MTELDLSAPSVTTQIRRIVGLLDSAPHLFMDLPWFVDRHLDCIAPEIMPNPTAAKIEDLCMRSLGRISMKKGKFGLIRELLSKELIDVQQAVFLCLMHGIDPRDCG